MDRENLVNLVRLRADECTDRPLYSFLDRRLDISHTISFFDLYLGACNFSRKLRDRSWSGKAVILLFPHGPEFVYAFFGCIFAGVIPVPLPLPKRGNLASLKATIKNCRAVGLITVERTASLDLCANMSSLGLETLTVDAWHLGANGDYPCFELPADSAVAFIQYSSGSTASPKGVAIKHSNIIDNSKRIKKAFNASEEDTGLCWLPFFHDMGLIGHIIQPLYSKIHNYFISPLSFAGRPLMWLEAITRYKATISGGPNFAYELCCSKIADQDAANLRLSEWRLAYTGSDKINPSTVEAFCRKFRAVGFQRSAYYACYGLAESTLFVCGTSRFLTHKLSSRDQRYVSVGVIEEDDCSVVIVDPSSLKIAGPCEVGEVCVSSPSVASGYFNDEELTAGSFNLSVNARQGYLRTGDVGLIKDNNLYIVGRYKSLIKQHGTNYFAEDIEAKALEVASVYGIEQAAAFSVRIDNCESLIVLLEQGREMRVPSSSDQLPQVVRSHIVQELGIIPFAVKTTPKNSLPLTTSGKLQRNRCRELYLHGIYA